MSGVNSRDILQIIQELSPGNRQALYRIVVSASTNPTVGRLVSRLRAQIDQDVADAINQASASRSSSSSGCTNNFEGHEPVVPKLPAVPPPPLPPPSTPPPTSGVRPVGVSMWPPTATTVGTSSTEHVAGHHVSSVPSKARPASLTSRRDRSRSPRRS